MYDEKCEVLKRIFDVRICVEKIPKFSGHKCQILLTKLKDVARKIYIKDFRDFYLSFYLKNNFLKKTYKFHKKNIGRGYG